MMGSQVQSNPSRPKTSLKPSDEWGPYTDSHFSQRHLNSYEKKKRTSTIVLTAANLLKMYVGIAFISTPKMVQMGGIYDYALGIIYVLFVNLFATYILLMARNRFKRDPIVDISDLSAKLYGEWLRPIVAGLLVITNATFLMCYVMFFGTQTDQLMCKTWKYRECGNQHLYSILIILAISPIFLQRKLAAIGYFSIFILILTFISIGLIIYLCIIIYTKPVDEVDSEYGLHMTEEDRQYKYFDGLMWPVVASALMSLFEGSQ